jgi:hypothetical protein
MDIGKERKEIIVVPVEAPSEPGLDPAPVVEPAPAPAEPAKEPVGV